MRLSLRLPLCGAMLVLAAGCHGVESSRQAPAVAAAEASDLPDRSSRCA